MKIIQFTVWSIIIVFSAYFFITGYVDAGDNRVEQMVVDTVQLIRENRLSDAIYNTRKELREAEYSYEYDPIPFLKKRIKELRDELNELELKRENLRKGY